MSEESVAIARRAYEAFNRGDLQAMVADLAPNFEYATTGAIPGMTGVYRGAEGILGFLEWMRSEFERPRIEVHELVDAGDQVVAAVTLRGRGTQSGVEASWDVWHAWTMETARSCTGRHLRAGKKPLKPPGCRSRALDKKRLFWRTTSEQIGEQRPSDEAGTALAFEFAGAWTLGEAKHRVRSTMNLERLLRRDPELSSSHDNGSFAALDDFAPSPPPRPRLE